MKRFCFVLAVLCAAARLCAADFSAAENDFIQKVLSFRLSLRLYATPDECIEKILDFKKSAQNDTAGFSEEAVLTIGNMLATAQYNCEYEKDMKSPEMEPILRPQYEKIMRFSEDKEAAELNPWFVLTSADILNSMMQFLPRGDSIKIGLKEKKDYAAVLEQNPGMSFAYMLAGFWYYYAPAIGGGSKSKSKSLFEDSLRTAATDYERYYGNVNLSQIRFEEKNTAECDEYLARADEILPGTRYIAFIRKINSLGYSLFDYNMNSTREKLDKRLASEQK